MATAYQWVNSRKVRNIMVVSGGNELMLSFMVKRVLGALPVTGAVRYLKAGRAPDDDVVSPLGLLELVGMRSPLESVRTFVVSGIEAWRDLDVIERYAEKPDRSVNLIFTANRLRNSGKGWFAGYKSVQTVECSNMGEGSLLKFIKGVAGCGDADADLIADVCKDDLIELLRVCDVASVFKANPPVNVLCNANERNVFKNYGIVAVSGLSLHNALVHKVRQIMDVGLQMQGTGGYSNIASALGMEVFQVKPLADLYRKQPMSDWLALLLKLQDCVRHINTPVYPQYVAALLPE